MEKEKLEKNKILRNIKKPKKKPANMELNSSENVIILSDNENKKNSNQKSKSTNNNYKKTRKSLEKIKKNKKIKKSEPRSLSKNFSLFEDLSILFLMDSKFNQKESTECLSFLKYNKSEIKNRFEDYLKNLTQENIKSIFSFIQNNGINSAKINFGNQKQFESITKEENSSENSKKLLDNFLKQQNSLQNSMNSFFNECKTITGHIANK